jgi:hypothetical protein
VTEGISNDARADALAGAVAQHVNGGWRVESQTDYSAALAKRHRPNDVLHLILTIITLSAFGSSSGCLSRFFRPDTVPRSVPG